MTDLSDADVVESLVAAVRSALAREGSGLVPECARIQDEVQAIAPLLPSADAETVTSLVRDLYGGLSPLQPLFDDPDVSEIMVNGGDVWFERRGQLHRRSRQLDREAVARLIEEIVVPLDRRVDRASPLVDARLPDGSRVNVVIPPLAPDGPSITIRRFRSRRIGLDEFTGARMADVLVSAVRERANIVVSGGTGSGKTTLLNALGSTIAVDERIVTIEDTVELDLGLDHVVRLEARDANAEGLGAVDIRALLRNALRMRPDRIVVGEVRGSEVLDMLQAMNTGHEGSLSTCHANSPRDALRRLETMCLLGAESVPAAVARDLVSSSIDLVVQVGRGADGRRSVRSVVEVVDRIDWTVAAGLRRLDEHVEPQAAWRDRQNIGGV